MLIFHHFFQHKHQTVEFLQEKVLLLEVCEKGGDNFCASGSNRAGVLEMLHRTMDNGNNRILEPSLLPRSLLVIFHLFPQKRLATKPLLFFEVAETL